MNLSDYDHYRPGIAACDEMGILHPFVDVGISKDGIRYMARNMELSFWNEPSLSCPFSIIPHRERIAIENMKMVGLAGYFLNVAASDSSGRGLMENWRGLNCWTMTSKELCI